MDMLCDMLLLADSSILVHVGTEISCAQTANNAEKTQQERNSSEITNIIYKHLSFIYHLQTSPACRSGSRYCMILQILGVQDLHFLLRRSTHLEFVSCFWSCCICWKMLFLSVAYLKQCDKGIECQASV